MNDDQDNLRHIVRINYNTSEYVGQPQPQPRPLSRAIRREIARLRQSIKKMEKRIKTLENQKDAA